jgi:hypothetical protein
MSGDIVDEFLVDTRHHPSENAQAMIDVRKP